jgi:penicillin amidase
MDLSRRRALGRRAEVLGEAFVESDQLVRVVDIPRWGRTNEAALFRDEAETWALLQAWTEGVNARIQEVLDGEAPLPAEFTTLGYLPDRWAPSDPTAFGKAVLFGNANQIESTILAQILERYLSDVNADLGLITPLRDSYVLPPEERPSSPRRAVSHHSADAPSALPPDAAERVRSFQRWIADFRPGASNNWAVDGRHTDNGRPLVAGDPHQPLASPSLFWMHHEVAADGSLDVAGWSFVGGPAVQLGHNRHVAWTATTTYGDMMDLWDVRVVSGVAHVGGVEVPLVRRTETIAVAGGEPLVVEVDEVPGYGVLLPDGLAPLPLGRPARRLLFRWTGFGPTHELEGFLGFDRARSIEVLTASTDTPLMTFEQTGDFYSPDCDDVMMPVPMGGALEGETGYECASNGDCHLIVIDRRVNHLFEMWRANITGGTFYGGCLAAWDMTRV